MQITVNETGAKTLRDSRPMMIDGQKVYVVVDSTASLFIGGLLVDVRRVSEVSNATEAQAWAVEYRDGMNVPAVDWDEVTVADEAAVAEATDTEAVYADAVASIHVQAAALRIKADEAAAHGDADYKFRSSLNGRWITLTSNDPRHPSKAAASLGRDADRLAAWTATDEAGYSRYVSDGIGDTDGYYAPIDRSSWKATIGA